MPYVHPVVIVTVSVLRRQRQVGAILCQLDLRKKAAVENEDYDTAKLIKVEMDKLRSGPSYVYSDHDKGMDQMGAPGGGGAFGGRCPNVIKGASPGDPPATTPWFTPWGGGWVKDLSVSGIRQIVALRCKEIEVI